MSGIAQKLQTLFPQGESLRDWIVANDGAGDSIVYFNPALGTQPTQAQLDAVTDQQVNDAQKAKRDAAAPDLAAMRDAATQAIADINTFLAIATPTNAQVVAEVRNMDQRQRAIIKAVLKLASQFV